MRKGIDLSLEAPTDVLVTGNALLLHELVANLVDNAIRYTPCGGKVALRVLIDRQPLLEVEDSGIGIAVADRERVFQPFYRAMSAQQTNAGGAGLGLTIVRDIAALHDAELELADAHGASGLLLRVRFPD